MAEKFPTKLSRRAAVQAIGLAGAAALVTPAGAQAPAVRKRVTLSYWTWTDNPGHQKLLVDVVDGFNESQDMIAIQLDAGSRTMEVRQKVMVAYAAGAAPDIAGVVQTHVQDYFDSGVLWPVEPFFSKWDQKDDYFLNIVAFMRSKPGQPVLYMPGRTVPYVLYYRADWFDEAKVAAPKSYDEFIEAARRLTKPDEHVGYAMRGVDYYAVQPIEPIWGSARRAIRRTERHGGFRVPGGCFSNRKMGGHVHEGQVRSVNGGERRLPATLLADGERQGGDVDLWHACQSTTQYCAG
jgi:multiple sugar transport system substrate-binding protein